MMDIKYLILSSGGPALLNQLGALSLFVEKKYIEYEKIQSIYSCSSGAFIAVLFYLNIDIDEIIEYFIERPWNKLFDVNLTNMINIYSEMGLFDINTFKSAFDPLFKIKNLNTNITFKEFYEYNKKDLYIFATNHETFESTVFSHKNTPDVSLMEALYMSCTVPFILKPLKHKNSYHVDGVYTARFPIKSFLKDNPDVDLNEVFGMYLKSKKKMEKKETIKHNFLSFHLDIIIKLLSKNNEEDYSILDTFNHICCLVVSGDYSIDYVYDFINNSQKRKSIINEGYSQANIFLMNKYNL